jgi:purine-nucleoside/S-methyl-5'-thioadenosine phosphorylase / adenosine deaminase
MPRPSGSKKSPLSDLSALDARLRPAGLTRSTRRVPGPDHSPTFARVDKPGRIDHEELALPAPAAHLAANGVGWLPVLGWQFPWLWSGFSTRIGGVSRAYSADDASGELNLGFTAADDRESVAQNRRMLAEAVTGSAETPLVTLSQFHSTLIVSASRADTARKSLRQGDGLPRRADGIMTSESGFLVAVQTADCIPVLVADTRLRVVAAFHAGWRGTVKRIVESGVGRMMLDFGSRPADLVAAIGPGIGACCYAVGDEVLSEFDSQFCYARELFREVYDADPVRKKYPMLFLTQRAPGHSLIGPHHHLDLIEANRRQLLSAGLRHKAIQVVGGCTQCHNDLFFSHRGSHGHAGRMMAVIGLRATQKNG